MLREMCCYANNLYNKALYEVRQHYFATGKYLRYEKNYHVCKLNENYKMLQACVACQTLRYVDRAIKAFFALKKEIKAGRYPAEKNRLPQYKKKQGLFPLILSKDAINILDGQLNVPMSYEYWRAHGKYRFKIHVPPALLDKKIKEVHIIPVCRGRVFKAEYVYECEKEDLHLDQERVLGIDFGLENFCACADSDGRSFLIDGRRIKSINHYWQQRRAKIQAIYIRQGRHTGSKLEQLTLRRNEQIQDIMRKAARYIMDYCREHNIGRIVAGKPSWKWRLHLGKSNNQNIMNIPYWYFRRLLRSQCERNGMIYDEVNEAYTSKASFLDGDILPEYDPEKKTQHNFSGTRLKRGLYRSSSGRLINADINGAANILRKGKHDLNFERVCRGLMHRPERIRAGHSGKLHSKC